MIIITATKAIKAIAQMGNEGFTGSGIGIGSISGSYEAVITVPTLSKIAIVLFL